MTKRLNITLPLPPSLNRLWRTTKTGRMYKSPEYNEWKTAAQWDVVAQIKGQQITGKFKLTLIADRPDKRPRDLDNLLKAALDCLNGIAIDDDHNCDMLEAWWASKGTNCQIIIEELKDGETKRVRS
jgi:crossover junction endodeoxyribonuclease RusA